MIERRVVDIRALYGDVAKLAELPLYLETAKRIAALLDRLTHHADISLIEGTSYRVRESEGEAAARKKKPETSAHAHRP